VGEDVDGDCVPFVPPSSDKSNSEKKLPAAQPLHVVDPGEANRPASHEVQCEIDVAPAVCKKVSFGHIEQAVAPDSSEYVPEMHGKHRASEMADCTIEYFPGAQWRQASSEVDPSADEYLPLGQLVHVDVRPVALEYFPASHKEQAEKLEAPVSAENVPEGHATHASGDEAPVEVKYVPAMQSAQGTRSSSVISATHPLCSGKFTTTRSPLTDVTSPILEWLTDPHPYAGVETDTLTRTRSPTWIRTASVILYLPAPHSVHASLPMCSLKVPAPHNTQSTPDRVYPRSHTHSLLPASDVEWAGHVRHPLAPDAGA
jgi:hypothetical protein